ncbi:MAG: metal ABC transporter ATP-binding protein [Prochlorothrix sp.]|nr:metal ABC transporter ATP-binding protein [Prochlorothrix sp.]
MLDVQHLSVSYPGVSALVNLNLRLNPQELVGLMGPNGAGKSTLIKSILGLLPRQQGQVLWNHKPLRPHAKTVAYVPQRSQVDWAYPIKVEQAVRLACGQGWRWQLQKNAQVRVREALERLELWSLRQRPLAALSGGQQQRVFLARALAQNADLILLDEPFTGVDRRTEAILWQVLMELRSAGKAVLVCSHSWGDALHHFDRLVLLNREIIANDRPQAVLTWPNLNRAYGDNFPVSLAWGCPWPVAGPQPRIPLAPVTAPVTEPHPSAVAPALVQSPAPAQATTPSPPRSRPSPIPIHHRSA